LEIILDRKQQEAGDPGEVGLPLEPDQIFRKLGGSGEIFLHIVKAAAVDFPGFAGDTRRQAFALLQ
jgi:hypothetical protein